MARLTTPTPASLFNASDEDEAGAAVGGPGDRVKGDSHLPSSMETQRNGRAGFQSGRILLMTWRYPTVKKVPYSLKK